MKHLLEAVKKAAKDTSAYMTFDVRNSARAHGWSPEEAASLRVRYDDGKFTVHAEGEHAEAALTKEYGTETERPTAVIRKYSNSSGQAEQVFINQLKKHSGGK